MRVTGRILTFVGILVILLAVAAVWARYGRLGPHGFRTAEGVSVPDLTGIEEGWCSKRDKDGYDRFTVNVSAEHIASYFERLLGEVQGPAFFVIEVPATEKEEEALRKSDNEPYHNQVYYLDSITRARARKIFERYERVLVNDGMVKFGFGAHKPHDEVFFGSYKILNIYTTHPEKYERALNELGVPRRDTLKTVWGNFTAASPGTRKSLDDKPTKWDMVEELKKEGLYLAETREEK